VRSSGSFPLTKSRPPSAKDGEFDVSPAVSQSLSSSMPFSSAQLYPASCPLQSEVQGSPAKVRGFGVVVEVSVDPVV